MNSHIFVVCDAYVVSSLVIRFCMWVLGLAGLTFKPNWVYDNSYNFSAINAFLRSNSLPSLSLYLLSISLALVIGSFLGWFLASISGRLRGSYLMMFLFIISDAGALFAANNIWIAGGTMGCWFLRSSSTYRASTTRV